MAFNTDEAKNTKVPPTFGRNTVNHKTYFVLNFCHFWYACTTVKGQILMFLILYCHPEFIMLLLYSYPLHLMGDYDYD